MSPRGRRGGPGRIVVPVAAPVVAIALAGLVSGCVSIELEPREVIGETVKAGKSAYRTLRRKLNGTEERVYTHTVPIDGDVTEHDAGIACLAYLHGIADAAADDDEATVFEESTELLRVDAGRAMRCSLRVEV